MSQAGIVDFIGTHPDIPILFVCNVGSAVPIGNTLEILGSAVTAHSIPLETVGSGNTVNIEVQYSSAAASSAANNAGIASFNSTYFTVDANGFVSINGAAIGETITGNTGGALSPTAGNWNILGTSTAPGTTPVQTSGTASTLTVQVQKAQAIASTNATNVGLAAFNSSFFTVDSNGFVSLNGSGSGETITGNIGGALSPTAGNWNILGSSTAAGTTPVQTSGSVSTLTIQVQKSQAIASTDATKVGLAAFDSARFSVDANGFVTLAGTGAGETITGNSGGALAPTAGNWNIVGTGSITTSGSVSTLTVQLTGLTNHNVLVGAGTATVTNVAPSATSGVPLISQGAAADPAFGTAVVAGGGTGATTLTNHGVLLGQGTSTVIATSVGATGTVLAGNTGADPTFQTIATLGGITSITGNSGGAEVPSAGNFNILGTGSITVAGSANTETVQLTGLTNHAVQVGAGTATLTQVGPTATTGAVLQNNAGADPTYSTASYPSTTTINQILYSSAADAVSGLATVNSAVLVTTSAGVPGFSGTMTNGQLIIGSTGATPTAATLTAGAGISITNAAGGITISATGAGFTWNNKAISYSAVAENGYRSTAAVTGSLPAAGATDGTTILFQATTTDIHTIAPATTDVIQLGNKTSTNGTGGGSIASTAKGDAVELVYQNSTGTWFAQNFVGNWTIT